MANICKICDIFAANFPKYGFYFFKSVAKMHNNFPLTDETFKVDRQKYAFFQIKLSEISVFRK